ncbi:MAG: ABC transporter ATP-binding protein [Kofleriaceae bacterium]|nr:ABC transporter ATP-binding protein [Kofleriaceae bacterium]
MIACEQVGFDYGTRAIVAGVSLEVGAGELCAVVGPNGAGKTTLVRILAGLLPAARGRVRVGDLDPATAPRREVARRLAYVPQLYELAFPFTVAEVVLMGRYAHRGGLGLEDDADLAAAHDAMRRCDVDDLEGRRFDTLSGGEQRRALLAQAFCQGAATIILDEPTAALDPAHAHAVMAALRATCADRGAAALVVTHDLNLAARWTDRVIVMARGAVAAAGPATEVLAAPATAAAFGVPLHVGTLPGGAAFVVPA